MKNMFLLIITALISLFSTAQNNQLPQLSPRTQMYLLELQKNEKNIIQKDYAYRQTQNGIYMSALIKVSPQFDESIIETMGVHIGTRAGAIRSVMIPVNKVADFTKTAGIEYIELDELACMKLDSVRRVTHVDSVHAGINLYQPYTGKGIVVGVVDAGFDFSNPALYDTLANSYRVKRIWEEKKAGTPPTLFGYGNEITDTAIMKTSQTDEPTFSHGMHVTGMAAGSGFGSANNNNKKYRGMAYESDIVLVGIMPDSSQWQGTGVSDFLDGINYVFKYADAVNEPAVVNLSWGTVVGPHDGTSLFSQACDALTNQGRIFVVSGGNNGQDSIHLQKTFTSNDASVSTFVTFDNNFTSENTWIDVWGETGNTFCIKVSLFNGNKTDSTVLVCLDNNIHQYTLTGSDNKPCIVTLTTSTSEFNGKPRIYLSLGSNTADTICITLTGTSGTIHLWDGYIHYGEGYFGKLTANGRSWATNGDAEYTTSDIVSTRSCISAGAFTSKAYFTSLAGGTYGFGTYAIWGHVAPFSSHGPTVDGRIKPDISAPGLCVVSSVNSYDTSFSSVNGSNYISNVSKSTWAGNGRTYYYAELAGTSMASPATTGIVALMLEANPYISPADIKNIFTNTAIHDNFTGALPASGTNIWGHGKINAWAAVWGAFINPVSGIKSVIGNTLDCKLFPNPNNGSFTLTYTSEKEQTLFIEMYDVNGRIAYSDYWKVAVGSNSKTCSVAGLSKGLYMTRIESANGSTVLKNVVN